MRSKQAQYVDPIFQQLAALPDAMEAELNRTASEAQARAQALVPVLTGRLRASIEIERAPKSVSLKAKRFYGRFVEFGTKKMKAEPYMRPAMTEALQHLDARIQERMKGLK